MFDILKTIMIGLPSGEKKHNYVSLAVSIEYKNATEGQTDGQNCYINIATREKKFNIIIIWPNF